MYANSAGVLLARITFSSYDFLSFSIYFFIFITFSKEEIDIKIDTLTIKSYKT